MWLAQYIPSSSSNSIRPTAERHNKTMPTTNATNGMTTTQKAILRCRARASSPARDAAGSAFPVGLHTCCMQVFYKVRFSSECPKAASRCGFGSSPNQTLQHLSDAVKSLYSPVDHHYPQPFDCGRISPF